ncbi:MAG: hypothetical protein ACYDCH_06005 [Gaiellaceae bacterium]
MSTKKRTTMSKMNRERELREKRVRKQERKDQKKLAAALGETIEGATGPEGDDAPADSEPGPFA